MAHKLKVVTLFMEGESWTNYWDPEEAEQMLADIKKNSPGLAHFVNGKCIYHGVVAKAVCKKMELAFLHEIN